MDILKNALAFSARVSVTKKKKFCQKLVCLDKQEGWAKTGE